MRRLVLLTLGSVLVLGPGCGGEESGPVRARNLTTGEIESFDSESDIPTNYAPCTDAACSVPSSVPCQSLGTKVCPLHPACRLKKLWCMGSGSSSPGGGAGSSDSSAGSGSSGSTTEQCQYTCIPKLPLLCEELLLQKECQARTDCEWSQANCPLACPEGGACPECPSVCQSKQAATCQTLAETTCKGRSDCQWTPGVCTSGCTGPTCCKAGTCQPKSIPPVCPTIAPLPPDYCKGGTVVPKYDTKGCLVGYDCTTSPTVTCADVGAAYLSALKAAKVCNPLSMTAVVQCGTIVDDQLACPCPTTVNSLSTSELAKLKSFKQQWVSLGCDKQQPACGRACLAVSGTGTCVSASTGTATAGVCSP